ncbi:alpha-ketoglutarate catabolism dioxygenase [Dacryopinax primogenitus]|uniref:Alpha-ketoglutarate catabolism dioxygenase n=1 Tax=Dacryopinax primogenitus (strain DJM 731) TaxID=1858805 RepID=M5FZ71_DACPD|nr:alpha-ketoglutarate catabolism dioxygenase [Dacryopinax primogenitus]EJT96792.1 alpha-ketoglutarate catabolism dioxygenase [Dacryopinax primogenitus]
MAPSVAEKTVPAETAAPGGKDVKVAPAVITEDKGPSYPAYYPTFDLTEKWPPTELFEHHDPGLRADPLKPHLLNSNTTVHHLSPYIGTELLGIQLSQLPPAGLDELALFVAERKLVVLRDQDFKDLGFERQIELAKHFGPIQRHPTSGNVPGYPEFHVVYRDPTHDRFQERRNNRLSQVGWHSDVSYERQPPGTTIFWILDQPALGGDTLFLSQVEAYNRLSPAFKKRLEGLRAVHSAVEQAEFSAKRGGPVRREPVATEHPLVRVHPVTGEKALYVNPGFTRRIVGYKQEESDNLLQFLYDHIAKGADFQVRAGYKPGTVVLWDNRVTVHSATPDYDASKERRHCVRLTPQAEVPVEAKADEE